ncbi:MAG: hypothetical protein MHM6MM_007500, partial [Cercozoa sp. M6MM]
MSLHHDGFVFTVGAERIPDLPELRVLQLDGCPLKKLPPKLRLHKLRALDLRVETLSAEAILEWLPVLAIAAPSLQVLRLAFSPNQVQMQQLLKHLAGLISLNDFVILPEMRLGYKPPRPVAGRKLLTSLFEASDSIRVEKLLHAIRVECAFCQILLSPARKLQRWYRRMLFERRAMQRDYLQAAQL